MSIKLSKRTILGAVAALLLLAIAVSMLNRDRPTFGIVAGDPSEEYIEIRELMAKGDWKAANTMATTVALETAGRLSAGWFDQASIQHFPCAGLYYLDALYSFYSDGRFGIGAQHEVFREIAAAEPDAPPKELFLRFADAVGWREDGDWIPYSELFGDIDAAPKGHLPAHRRAEGRLPAHVQVAHRHTGPGGQLPGADAPL